LTKPSRWKIGQVLWKNAARSKPLLAVLQEKKVYDVSKTVFGGIP
jgi:hypothetical protein